MQKYVLQMTVTIIRKDFIMVKHLLLFEYEMDQHDYRDYMVTNRKRMLK